MIEINKIPIFQKINIDNASELMENVDGLRFDNYCNKCKTNSTFISAIHGRMHINHLSYRVFPSEATKKEEWFIKNVNEIINIRFNCARNDMHKIFYNFLITEDGLIKIGQYPSDRDLIDNNLAKRIKKLIDKNGKVINDYLNKSIILNSEGYGVASTLYLRRAFEYVINLTLDYDTTEYIPMDKKINDNKYLPKEFKENKNIYNILSDGVHNLSDEECNNIFPIIFDGIVFLLEEYFHKVEKQGIFNTIKIKLQQLGKKLKI